MRKLVLASLLFVATISTYGQTASLETAYTLGSFFEPQASLAQRVDDIYNRLSEKERIAQMIVTSTGRLGKPYETVTELVKNRKVGGVIFLSGDTKRFRENIANLNNVSKGFPQMYSIDAEPSLFNTRLTDTDHMPPTNALQEVEEVTNATAKINDKLNFMGMHWNYAPVVDLSEDNEAIRNRSFSADPERVVQLAGAFISESQSSGIVATAKHFPGHGRISGDTHKNLAVIEGELTELPVYPPLIERGVISIMVGHIAVMESPGYDTDSLPSTCSRRIVSELLRDELGFEGIIVTDALNMGALNALDNAPLMAAKAGCDILLMPPNEEQLIEDIYVLMQSDADFAQQIEASVKRIIKLKTCLGLNFGAN